MKNRSMARVAKRAVLPLAAAIAMAAPGAVLAQATSWRVVAGENGGVLSPDLPAGTTRNITDVYMGDMGRDLFGFRVSSPTALEGYWAQRGNRVVRYTQGNSTGALGPGRGGAEASHVFLSINSGWGGASPDGQRNFLARAGDPAATLNASYGLWRWTGTGNVEVARGSAAGLLGPGLGAGWVFLNNSSFATARMLDGGRMLMYTDVRSPTGADSTMLAMHVPGTGNVPCMRAGATDPALAPGIVAGDSFSSVTSGIARFAVNPAGTVYGRAASSGSREGIWEFCDGAPRAIAVTGETGARGPNMNIENVQFSGFTARAPMPASGDDVVFYADWRVPPSSGRLGLFLHDGVANRGIVYNEPSGYYGPNWAQATWRSFFTDMVATARDVSAFVAGLDTADGGDPTGLFRVRHGERPELVALLGLTGDYEPEAGRTWRSFDAVGVLSNGDILLEATTNPNATRDLWLLRAGEDPRRILSIGQPISVQTAQGAVQTTVSSFDVPDGGAGFSDGGDRWIGADGTLYLSVLSATHGRVLITTKLDVPNPDVIFASDFE